MVFDASPSTATLKMKEYFLHMAHMSYDCACAQDGYLKRPHPTINLDEPQVTQPNQD
jgi:hypothetical protein